jgi:four helix bundle protein
VPQRPIRSYRDLIVWQKAMRLVTEVHDLTRNFPRSRDHGLGGQMRRAALSVPSNIAEGHGRDHLRDYLRHLSIAKGSLAELETQILSARAIAGVPAKDVERLLDLCAEIGKMLNVLYRKLKAKLPAKDAMKRAKASPALPNPLTPDTWHPAPGHLSPDT